MSLEGPGKLMRYEDPRMMIYVSRDLAIDSAFPFKRGDDLWIRVDTKRGRLIVTKRPKVRGKAKK